jgi:hypothetical protein
MNRNAVFLCERLCAQFPAEVTTTPAPPMLSICSAPSRGTARTP